MEGKDRITAVVIENKSGRQAIEAGSFIDCTGDADLCALSGAKTALHEGGNGLASWYYYFDGNEVKLKMFGLADIAVEPEADNLGKGRYEAVIAESLDKNVRFSGVDGAELSNAVTVAHDKMYADILSFRKDNSAFWPVSISSIPLVRMSRRLVGAYEMDASEDHVYMEDSIGMTGDWRRRGPVFELPFRTLYGDEVKNLLAAGRAISVTDSMWDISRVIPPCAVTGEAAGTAASLGSDFSALNIGALQQKLVAQGVKLHLREH
jgi:hypothetical protein